MTNFTPYAGLTIRCIDGNVVRVMQRLNLAVFDYVEFTEYPSDGKEVASHSTSIHDWRRKVAYGEQLPDDWNCDPSTTENTLAAVKRMIHERGWIVDSSLPLDKTIERLVMDERNFSHQLSTDLFRAEKRIAELELLCQAHAEKLQIFDEWTK